MPIERRQFLTATLALTASEAIAQPFPPPVPDVPTTEIEKGTVASQNAEIIRKQNALLNAGDIAGSTSYLSEDTRNFGVPVGRKGLVRVLTDILGTFPDWNSEIISLMAMDDQVVVRAINTGTHKGIGKVPVNGGLLVGVPPTNKQFKVQSMHWYTLKGGLIVEHRATRDDIGMMQQLGLLPMSARYDLSKVEKK
jgi:predicted ester cyclase